MRSDDIRAQGPLDLLDTYACVLHGLRRFGVVRSFNHPVGDVAEYWVSQNLGWSLMPPSHKSYDAVDAAGLRYQIKARWRTRDGRTPRMCVQLTDPPFFDFLVGVVFDQDFHVDYAAILPVDLVRGLCRRDGGSCSGQLSFPRRILRMQGVRSITDRLQYFPPTEEERRWGGASTAAAPEEFRVRSERNAG